MMRNEWWRGGLAASLLLVAALPVAAKTRLDKVTISGPGLNTPVDITDEEILRLANPWFGKFIEWSAPAVDPHSGVAVYDVTLYARLRASELRPIYQFRYAPGTDGQRGLVYLPGKGEPWHHQNVSIITRDNHDGRWNPASSDWDARVKAALAVATSTGKATER
jgi:hypothetical protein